MVLACSFRLLGYDQRGATVSGTPAEKVGVLPGDKIVYIENESVAGIKNQNTDVFKRLRGKRGTPVNIRVKRGNAANSSISKSYVIKYLSTVWMPLYMLTDKIGYIKINSF